MQSKRYRIYVIFVAVAVLLTSSVAPIFAWGGGGPTPDPDDSPGPGAGCGGGGSSGGGGGGGGDPCGSPVHTVNPFTGDLVIWDIPVSYASVGAFPPFYVSYSAQTSDSGPLGDRWTHSFHARIIDDSPYGAWVVYGNGNRYYYPSDGQGGYISPEGVFDELRKDVEYFTRTSGDDSCTCPPGEVTSRIDIDHLMSLRPPPSPSDHAVQKFSLSGRLLSITDPAGLEWDLSYNVGGELTTITDPAGRNTTLQYTGGLLTKVTVPGGLYATFQYDSHSPKRLWKITDAVGDTYTFGYSGTRVTSITGPDGRQIWYQYGTFNNKTVLSATGITGVTDSTVTCDYSEETSGELYVDITQTKDEADRVVRHIYEFTDDPGSGRYYGTELMVIVDPDGVDARSAYAYDSEERVVQMRDSYEPETGGKPHRHFFYYENQDHPRRDGRAQLELPLL
jgi:YD repeat-containing protein